MSEPILRLGEFYVSDFVKEQPKDRKKYSLDLYVDEDLQAVRLKDVAPAETMWGQYWYRSGINASMTKELNRIVTEITDRVKLKDGDVWLDIACNDGTLLRAVPDNITKLGIDPADDTYHAESSKVAKVAQTYFNKAAYDGLTDKKAKVITCIAMFYDLDDPVPFVKDLYECLDEDGLLVLQMSYTPLMINQLAFDNICHEHTYYYSLASIGILFQDHGFKLVDASLNDTNGGSMRVYLQKATAKPNSFGSRPLRDVCNMRLLSLLEHEQHFDLRQPEMWREFGDRLIQLRSHVVNFIEGAIYDGKVVWAYGASTKGNTLLQYFGLNREKIIAIAERSPYKYGLRTIGTDIPIVSEERMRYAQPDYVLILPWHFIDEFVEREREYLEKGGAFIVPCPEFKIITKDDLL
jgi:cyclopropane fatty-acyl-phospholipid synthase-like methyltransferase